ncbi:hypothetical protein B0T26DRAFT_743292 [Lasiosphaeria miniovina]|uniref:Transcription factor BYE1 n=1 Tax=Lasiosphaeria miniovina TaxID=1954250 RepID=A0AA40A6G4_9PEZI|nr:uncharacterized protein B0T26DRAFT_743292 [Lasiosphaeria miniovina]KAK0710100.1 hypothetical protein B0T26DRAFT_743292 [Lasiosphaeria miniovina]
MSEPEPRRSVRATKGQHKALEQLDQAVDTPKRRGKKGKKAAPEPEEPEEEVIRCVCGATEQDEDSGEPWIACDQCGAWQHNICMGMSQYSEDLPKDYFCEICRPESHKELLAGMARGERPWEARRRAYEEEKTEKKKKGPKKGANKKRTSESKEDSTPAPQKLKQSPAPPTKPKQSPAPPPTKAKPSAAPPAEPKKDKENKSTAGQKRKTLDGSQDKEAKKMRKISETQALPIQSYTAPDDIPAKITELPEARQGSAVALSKALNHALEVVEKRGTFVPTDGISIADRAERFALEIERAVHDTHGSLSAYAGQLRTLSFNLKTNFDLCTRLLNRTLSPLVLSTMTSESLATKELQKETAELKALVEKQAIKLPDDGPRIRKTHKGEELIGGDDFTASDDAYGQAAPSKKVQKEQRPGSSAQPGHVRPPAHSIATDTNQSPNRADFDINKVFSSVKSPTLPQNQVRQPVQTAPATGPGVDLDVDRLLDDGSQSPPYSPSAESDPDVVWRGGLLMNSIAEFQVTGKHIGGVKLNETINLPWSKLIPQNLTVCGRIEPQQAIVYLCGLRYSVLADIVVISLEPTFESSRPDMLKLIDYFVTKGRYGVVGDKGVANVRDTYLVPVMPGTANYPEFMLNLSDNLIPETRTEPLLLAVFVYRNDPETVQRLANDPNHPIRAQQLRAQSISDFSQSPSTPTPAQGFVKSVSGTLPSYPPSRNTPQVAPPVQQPHVNQGSRTSQDPAQIQGLATAREIMGSLMTSPTMAFLIPQAHQMTRREWELIKILYETDPKTRDDLPYLSHALERQGKAKSTSGPPAQHPVTQKSPQVQQPRQAQQPRQVQQPRQAPPPRQIQQPFQARPEPQAQQPQSIQQQLQQQQKIQQSPQAQQLQLTQQPQQAQHAAAVSTSPTATKPSYRHTPVPPPPILQQAVPPRPVPSRQTPIPPPPIPPPASTPVPPS